MQCPFGRFIRWWHCGTSPYFFWFVLIWILFFRYWKGFPNLPFLEYLFHDFTLKCTILDINATFFNAINEGFCLWINSIILCLLWGLRDHWYRELSMNNICSLYLVAVQWVLSCLCLFAGLTSFIPCGLFAWLPSPGWSFPSNTFGRDQFVYIYILH